MGVNNISDTVLSLDCERGLDVLTGVDDIRVKFYEVVVGDLVSSPVVVNTTSTL